MKASVVRPGDLGPAEVELWRGFQAAAELDSPFLAPEFAQAAGEVSPLARVAVVYDGADLVGFLPFAARRFGGAKGIGCIAPGIDMSNSCAFIPSGASWTLEEVVRAARIDFFEFALLVADQRPATGAARRLDALSIDLSRGFGDYVASVRQSGGKFVKTLMQKRRSEERNDPALRFEYATGDMAVLQTLFEMKSARLRQIGARDLFAHTRARELVERLAVSKSPACAGANSCLRSGERVLAVNLGLRSSTVFGGWFSAYDTGEASRSPGSVCLLSLIEAAAESGLRTFDLGPGDHEYKRRLATAAVDVFAGSVGRPSLGRRSSMRVGRLLAKARR